MTHAAPDAAAARPTLWIDGDACPTNVRDICIRAARRKDLALVLVANAPVTLPADARFRLQLVPPQADAADRYIAEHCVPGDIIITADIPLAAEGVERGARVLSPRGEEYTEETVGERLAMRNLMEELRGAGLVSGGPASPGARETQQFANALDRLLGRLPPPPGSS
ncbi:MAG: YaiI/YqxD family protein [Planctomycetota bacterium]